MVMVTVTVRVQGCILVNRKYRTVKFHGSIESPIYTFHLHPLCISSIILWVSPISSMVQNTLHTIFSKTLTRGRSFQVLVRVIANGLGVRVAPDRHAILTHRPWPRGSSIQHKLLTTNLGTRPTWNGFNNIPYSVRSINGPAVQCRPFPLNPHRLLVPTHARS